MNKQLKERLQSLKSQYDSLKESKETLLAMVDEAEIPENVYNSNAIENSTLTLKETEKILLEMELSRDVSVREVFEAKNLARVIAYTREKSPTEALTLERILLLHQMLIGGIDDTIAGRFRKTGEYVRVGDYIAPAPEHVARMVEAALAAYGVGSAHFVEDIARFHLDFESTHPFCDGNGRIGRVIINWHLRHIGFPRIIIRDKEKKAYYQAFTAYREDKNTVPMEKMLASALAESLHKRIAYLMGQRIITLADYIKERALHAAGVTNAARRQTIPAFREKGVWKISAEFPYKK